MNVTWLGHAAFLLEGRNAQGETVRIALDPYRAPDVGSYAPVDAVAEIVAISHENEKYHSYVAGITGPDGTSPVLVDGLTLLEQTQPQTILGVPFTAVRVWENEVRLEPIAMVGLTLDGIRVLHMGDCGHALSPEEITACGTFDVLLALAGNKPTIPLPDLLEFIQTLRPSIVIPMHFGNEKINLDLRPVGDFLELLPSDIPVRHKETATVSLTRDSLPASPEVWVLPPAR